MPLPLAIPLISAGASLLGIGGQAMANRRADERQNQLNREAQERANAENIKFWNMQNDYNSPNAQMSRLKQAGLNPNLVYGNGATTVAAGMPQSKAPEQRATSNAGAFSQVAATIGQSLQNDNLRKQNTLLIQEAALKAAQTASEGTKNSRSQFDLALAQDLRETSMETARENLAFIQDKRVTEFSKEAAISQQNVIRTQTMQDQVNKIKTDAAVAAENLKGQELKNALLDYEKQLNDMYMNVKDPRIKAALMFLERLTSKLFK